MLHYHNKHIHHYYSYPATFDVQSVEVEEGGDGLRVTGELMTNSRAAGYVVVAQGPFSSSRDIIRAVTRSGTQYLVSSTLSVPADTYSLHVYDLEENVLPHSLPALVMDDVSTTSGSNKFPLILVYS